MGQAKQRGTREERIAKANEAFFLEAMKFRKFQNDKDNIEIIERQMQDHYNSKAAEILQAVGIQLATRTEMRNFFWKKLYDSKH